MAVRKHALIRIGTLCGSISSDDASEGWFFHTNTAALCHILKMDRDRPHSIAKYTWTPREPVMESIAC